MLLTDYERKQAIGELQDKKSELEIIDLLQKYFEYEYSTIFEKEAEEKIKIARERYNHFNNMLDDFDIRKYTLYQLKREIPERFDVRSEYIRLELLKVIIFFEYLLTPLDTNKEGNIEKNKKIEEGKIVYSFYRGLIASGVCNLSKFQKAVRILGFETLTQDDFDNAYRRSMNDFLERLILDKYLIPFIDEYINYLP